MTTTVTTIWRDYDQYIGRRNASKGLPQTDYANPYPLKSGASELERDLCLLRFACHVQRNKMYSPKHLAPIRNKRLACYCAPKRCHGDVWVSLCDAERPQRELQIIIAQFVNRMFNNLPHDPTMDTPAPQARVAVSGSRHMMCDGKLTKMIEKGDAYREHYAQCDAHRALVQDAMHRLPVRYLELHHGACYVGGADDIACKVVQTWPTKIIEHPPEDTRPASFNKSNYETIQAVQGFVAFWDGRVEKSGTRNFISHAWPDEDWCIWIRYVEDSLIDQVYCGLRFSFIEEVLRG